MKIPMAFLLLPLSGCTAVVGSLPSFEYCHRVAVKSDRVGNNMIVDVHAECALPIGAAPSPAAALTGLVK